MVDYMKMGDIFYGLSGTKEVEFFKVNTIVECDNSHIGIQKIMSEKHVEWVDGDNGRFLMRKHTPMTAVSSTIYVKRIINHDTILYAKHYKLYRWDGKPIMRGA